MRERISPADSMKTEIKLSENQARLIEAIKRRAPEEMLSKIIDDLVLREEIDGLNFRADELGHIPLHIAILSENTTAVKKLLVYRNANIQNDEGNTPLHLAMIRLQDDIARLLLAARADASLQNVAGDTALHLYAKRGAQGGSLLLKEYEHKFTNCLYVQNFLQETPLHLAISYDNMSFFTFYVNALTNRYYAQVDLTHPDILHGPNGDNLVHTAVRRLKNLDAADNETRTYTIINLLASVCPVLFDEKNTEGTFKNCTPLELLKQFSTSKLFIDLLSHPYEVYRQTFASKQMLGTLQVTLNGLREENTSLKAQMTDMQRQLMQITQLLVEVKQQKDTKETAVVESTSPRLFGRSK